MPRPPARKLSRAVLTLMFIGAVLFAAAGAFVLAPSLFPRKPGEFSPAQVIVTTLSGMLGAMIGAGLGNRLLARK